MRGLRILLAEDNFINQKVAENLLEQCGHAVEIAEDGEQAVAMAEREPFDLVLMDVHMPKMDGLAAARAIRRRERGTDEHLPIIALTADAMKGDRERCLAAGMDAYVAKPIHKDELLTAMQMVLAAKTPPSVPALTRSSPDIDVLTLTGGDEGGAPAAFLPKFVGEEEVVVDLVELFLDDCPRRMHEIRDAVSARDPIALAAAARALKGSASILKAQAVVTWARRLERFAGAGDWEQVHGVMQFLEAAVARLLPELLAWRQTHSRAIKSEHAAPG
jgi:CheY-like chemotaxis protein